MQENNFSNTNIKQSHSRESLSGIFHARSYQIGKTLINKQQLRGRSPITPLGDDGIYVYEQQTDVVLCPPCGESTAKGGVRGLLSKATFFYTPLRPYRPLPPQGGRQKWFYAY